MNKKEKKKSLLIGIGPGYHHQIRILHSIIKEKCDSSMLFFHIEKGTDSIGEDLRLYSSMNYSDFVNTFNLFKDFIKKNNFDLIGLGFMSHHWDIYVELVKVIRMTLPNCKIIAGGVHAWNISSSTTLEHCDYICAAEGEELYSKLVDNLSIENNKSPACIPGLIEKHNGKTIHTPVKKYMPLDDIPFPTYGDKNTYSLTTIKDDKPTLLNEDTLVNSAWGFIHVGRGCVFKCTFCINSIHADPTVRLRSVDRVIEEIKATLKICKNVRSIFFMDEIFPVKGNFLTEFCEKYKKEINLPFQVTLYPHMLNEEKIKKLKSAGLLEIAMGLQSGSQRIRNDIYNRKDKNEMLLQEKTLLAKHKVMTYYDIIIRNPYENEADLNESLELVHKFKRPFYLKFYTLAYYPGHPITTRALKEKMIDPKEVDATIGYLAITTPHKISIAEHYWDTAFVIWHKSLRKRMIGGSKFEPYYLLMCYHGFWFIPQFILDFLYNRFKKNSKRELYTFSYLLEWLLIIRNSTLVQYFLIAMTRLKREGLIYVIKKIFSKAKGKLRLPKSVLEQVLYRSKS